MGFSTWFASLWDKTAPLRAKLRQFLAELLKGALEILLAALLDIAKQAVAQVAADPKILTNDDKRKAAAKIIADYAKQKGINAGDSVINLAIELAVQDFKLKNA